MCVASCFAHCTAACAARRRHATHGPALQKPNIGAATATAAHYYGLSRMGKATRYQGLLKLVVPALDNEKCKVQWPGKTIHMQNFASGERPSLARKVWQKVHKPCNGHLAMCMRKQYTGPKLITPDWQTPPPPQRFG
jgi:hypothetical protein